MTLTVWQVWLKTIYLRDSAIPVCWVKLIVLCLRLELRRKLWIWEVFLKAIIIELVTRVIKLRLDALAPTNDVSGEAAIKMKTNTTDKYILFRVRANWGVWIFIVVCSLQQFAVDAYMNEWCGSRSNLRKRYTTIYSLCEEGKHEEIMNENYSDLNDIRMQKRWKKIV